MKFRMDESTFPVHLLRYQPETGWITNLSGKRVGSFNAAPHHYETVCIGRNRILSHRIAWRLMTGDWPRQTIDHIDGNHRNNRWDNLREASPSENICNRGPQRSNKTGEIGVSFDTRFQTWRVGVGFNGVRVSARASHSISAVVAARLIRRLMHGEFAYESRAEAKARQHAALSHSRAVADLYDDTRHSPVMLASLGSVSWDWLVTHWSELQSLLDPLSWAALWLWIVMVMTLVFKFLK